MSIYHLAALATVSRGSLTKQPISLGSIVLPQESYKLHMLMEDPLPSWKKNW